MGRRFFIIAAFCVVLLGAILAGYWDMLDSEKLRAVREQASASIAELSNGRSPSSAPEPPSVPSAGSRSSESGTTGSAVPAPGNAPSETAASGASAGFPPNQPEHTAPSDTAAAGTSSSLPSFDILRVEPDGSAVLAGRAAPNTEVRLTDGAKTIGSARTSSSGDFAVVLDKPLPAGDHQIRIETGEGDGRSISSEVAIVSVPSPGQNGELLAMVEAPNRPSRIITMPGTGTPQADADTDSVSPGTPAATPDSPEMRASSDPASAPPATPNGPASGVGTPVPASFAVEAVEIENNTIYIAGRAPGTDTVRAYVDDRLIGEDARRSAGRFLITEKVDLPAGDHRIRIDMIHGDGQVGSRVEVPFSKPEGGTMSAIASADDPARPTQAAPPSPATPAPSSDGTTAGSTPAAPQASGPAEPAVSSATADAATVPSTPDAPRADAIENAPPQPDVADGSSPAVTTVQQPALESVNARVLIRRGDTLWRISRQTYGLGRRYTVIYLANGDQIRNPDRIYPGQVFRLPKDEAKDASTAAN